MDEEAANVWSCIQTYRYEKAKALELKYLTQTAIISKLESYPEKAEYHGHKSGGAGDGENPSASANLGKAILFLEVNAPVIVAPVVKKVGIHPKHKANLSKSQELMAIIRVNSNLGTMVSLLAAKDALWRNDKTAWSEYSLKYEAKKGKRPTK